MASDNDSVHIDDLEAFAIDWERRLLARRMAVELLALRLDEAWDQWLANDDEVRAEAA